MKEKSCWKCISMLPLEEFGSDSSRPDGRNHMCKSCVKEKNLAYRLANPDKFAIYKLREACKKYGITEEIYYDMVEMQSNRCYICGSEQPNKRLAIDHCHKSGKVRKLLCDGCNGGLGLFRDNKENLALAIKYLEEHYE